MNAWVVNCRTENFDVFVGRPSPFGNPFTHLPSGRPGTTRVATRQEAIQRFEAYVFDNPALVDRIKRELKGKILGCFCAPLPCHAEILARIANE